MRIKLIIILSLVSLNAICQKKEEVFLLDDFFEDYFKLWDLNVRLQYNVPDGNGKIYVVEGTKQLSGVDIRLLFLHETYPLFDKITIQTHFRAEKTWSIKDRYELINSWANPSFPASIFWDDERKVFVLTDSNIVFSKSVSLSRMDDMFLGFIAAIKDLNQSQKIKL